MVTKKTQQKSRNIKIKEKVEVHDLSNVSEEDKLFIFNNYQKLEKQNLEQEREKIIKLIKDFFYNEKLNTYDLSEQKYIKQDLTTLIKRIRKLK